MNDANPFDGASPAVAVALVARFLLELALLAGVAVLAWRVAEGWWRGPAAVLAVAAVATLWGRYLSPKASVALPAAATVAIEAVLFLGVGVGLSAVGLAVPAAVGVVTWIIDRIVLARRPRRTP